MDIPFLFSPLRPEGIGAAILCGLIIGLERQLSGKPTGIRTCSLICLGTYIFTSVGLLLQSSQGDPSRIVGQIVTGIGFLGAGVIMTRHKIVVGITSASVIWILAGIGILIGLEKYATAIMLSLLTVGILQGVTILERAFKSLRQGIFARLDLHKSKTYEGRD